MNKQGSALHPPKERGPFGIPICAFGASIFLPQARVGFLRVIALKPPEAKSPDNPAAGGFKSRLLLNPHLRLSGQVVYCRAKKSFKMDNIVNNWIITLFNRCEYERLFTKL